jgi:hypothetical protein
MNWFEFFDTDKLDNEQVQVVTRLEDLYKEFMKNNNKKHPTRILIPESEELGSWFMWVAQAYKLSAERVVKGKLRLA